MALWEPVVAAAPETLEAGDCFMRPPAWKLLCLCLGVSPVCLTASRCQDSYLVDSASSHMLVSKIKPCMSKYKQSIL
jgi:hypothetical protein